VKLYLVRHGRAAAAWDQDPDPGLDSLGQDQARDVANRLAANGPLSIVVSPLKRTLETAAPLVERWQVEPMVEPRIAEIQAPTRDLVERRRWLDAVMAGRWSAQDEERRAWRRRVIDALVSVRTDTVFFSHFVAINVAVGAATGNDLVKVFRPDHCSVTQLEADDGDLRLVALGSEMDTEVL